MKAFKLVAVSRNPNSFGLYGHVFVARDGEAWEVGRVRAGRSDNWEVGQVVEVPYHVNPMGVDGGPQWAKLGVEIPKRLPSASNDMLREVWGD